MDRANGCGPEWMWRWLKKALFDWFFETSCDKHDHGYTIGGNELRRWLCDWKFLRAMRHDVRCLKLHLKPVAIIVAAAFYLLVAMFGWLQFNYHGFGVPSQIISYHAKNFIQELKR